MATPTAAPMTRLRQLSREAASVRKSSSPLGGMVPASVKVREKLAKGWKQMCVWVQKNSQRATDIYWGMRPVGRRTEDEFMDETRRLRRAWNIQKGEGAMGLVVGQSGERQKERIGTVVAVTKRCGTEKNLRWLQKHKVALGHQINGNTCNPVFLKCWNFFANNNTNISVHPLVC